MNEYQKAKYARERDIDQKIKEVIMRRCRFFNGLAHQKCLRDVRYKDVTTKTNHTIIVPCIGGHKDTIECSKRDLWNEITLHHFRLKDSVYTRSLEARRSDVPQQVLLKRRGM